MKKKISIILVFTIMVFTVLILSACNNSEPIACYFEITNLQTGEKVNVDEITYFNYDFTTQKGFDVKLVREDNNQVVEDAQIVIECSYRESEYSWSKAYADNLWQKGEYRARFTLVSEGVKYACNDVSHTFVIWGGDNIPQRIVPEQQIDIGLRINVEKTFITTIDFEGLHTITAEGLDISVYWEGGSTVFTGKDNVTVDLDENQTIYIKLSSGEKWHEGTLCINFTPMSLDVD